MKIILDLFNYLSKNILGVGIVDFFTRVSETKESIQQAENLAQKQQFKEASMSARTILYNWSSKASWFENWLRHRYINPHLKQIDKQQRRWQTIVEGQAYFSQGIRAEQNGNLAQAIQQYKAAATRLLDRNQAQIRIAIIAIKTQDWETAISEVDGMNIEQAAYIRGFAYVKQKKWQQAQQAWQLVSDPQVQAQCQAIKIMIERPRLRARQEIEQQIDIGNLAQAKIKTDAFIREFGANSDPQVLTNHYQYILPQLAKTASQQQDWKTLVEIAQQMWFESPNIISLHNWAVASYYYVQTQKSYDYIIPLIVIWFTALANIHLNPSLKNLQWRENQPLNLQETYDHLKQLIDTIINTIKEQNLNQYFQLRDYYRLEVITLEKIGNPPISGMEWNQLTLTPGFYQKYCANHPEPTLRKNTNYSQQETRLLATLYTQWGLAVAVCLDGDTERGLQIKPSSSPTSEPEYYGQQFVSYYEGCYHLQKAQWQKAVIPLKQAKAEIRASSHWFNEVDKHCQEQRNLLSNEEEHLKFAEFWHDLLESQHSKIYLAEYRAEQIRNKIINDQISLEQALKELRKLQQLDYNNPVVIDLIDKVESNIEIVTIDQLIQMKRLEEVVRIAQSSRHQRVKYYVAQGCIQIVIAISQEETFNADSLNAMLQFGRWAYELCPNEPQFQEIYQMLRL